MEKFSINLILIVIGIFISIALIFNSFSGRYQLHNSNTDIVIDTWNGDKIIDMRMIHRSEGRAPIPICAGCSKTGIEYKY